MKFIPYATKKIMNHDCQKTMKYLNIVLKKLQEKDSPNIEDLTGIAYLNNN